MVAAQLQPQPQLLQQRSLGHYNAAAAAAFVRVRSRTVTNAASVQLQPRLSAAAAAACVRAASHHPTERRGTVLTNAGVLKRSSTRLATQTGRWAKVDKARHQWKLLVDNMDKGGQRWTWVDITCDRRRT